MTYILIFIFVASQKSSAVSAEFNDLASCRAAAAELQKQADRYGAQLVVCAAKGTK